MVLYHATYKKRLNSIKKNGLGNTKIKNWDFSKEGVICFSDDLDVAASFCGLSDDNVTMAVYRSGIVILAIDSKQLDESKLKRDTSKKDVTYEYNEVIPAGELYIIEDDGRFKDFKPLLTANKDRLYIY